jgi:hypothetical protein
MDYFYAGGTEFFADTLVDSFCRTMRALKAGMFFEGEVYFLNKDDEVTDLMALSCENLRRIGTMRNRGFGSVNCALLTENQNIFEKTISKLEKEVG